MCIISEISEISEIVRGVPILYPGVLKCTWCTGVPYSTRVYLWCTWCTYLVYQCTMCIYIYIYTVRRDDCCFDQNIAAVLFLYTDLKKAVLPNGSRILKNVINCKIIIDTLFQIILVYRVVVPVSIHTFNIQYHRLEKYFELLWYSYRSIQVCLIKLKHKIRTAV
jgi:hypothetical protein